MTSTFSDKITKVKNAIVNLIAVHENKTGSSSQKGHVQASTNAGYADVSGGAVGTDNGLYARADHQHTLSSAYATSSHSHGNLQSDGSVGTSNNESKNVVTDASGKITTEAKPTIPTNTNQLTNGAGFITSSSVPSASSTTPSADTTNGSVGSSTTWAKADHTHPKSSIYAEASHTHGLSNISDVSVVSVLVTYTDNTSETLNFVVNRRDNSNETIVPT